MIINLIKTIFTLALVISLTSCSLKPTPELSAENTLINYSKAILARNPSAEAELMHKTLLKKFRLKIRTIALNTIKTGQEEIFQEFSKVSNIREFDKLSAKQVYIRLRTRTYTTKLKNTPIDPTTKLVFLDKKKISKNNYQFITKFQSGKTGGSSGKRIFNLIKEHQKWEIVNIENIVGIDDLPTK